jgi:hypothetical protein
VAGGQEKTMLTLQGIGRVIPLKWLRRVEQQHAGVAATGNIGQREERASSHDERPLGAALENRYVVHYSASEGGKQFFFEKKEPKNFYSLAYVAG